MDHPEAALGIGRGCAWAALGAAWYLSPNVKVQANLIRADLDDVGDTTIFSMRFQVNF